ncbi:MAG: hypothetical protein GY832_11280 [Chloroflexi bacterium]|nr:hypothetical protein [Chloroflexota bacterium]
MAKTRKEPNKPKTVEEAVKQLTDQFGDGVIINLNDKPRRDIPAISTGSLLVDRALGIGGVPVGRVIEIAGPEGAGKSSLGLHIVAEAQKQFPDAPAIFIDMEHALDTDYAEAIGVDTEELLLSQPQSGTAALTIVKKMIGLASVIVVDSVPGLVTQAELDAEPGDSHVGILARLMSQHLKEVVPKLGLSDTTLVFINQMRMKIGGYGCFHGDALVAFADGSRVPIQTVVEKKLQGPILSFNEETGTIEPAKIVNWFENGRLDAEAGEKWLQLIMNGPGTINGRLGFACTPGHILFQSDGSTVCASDVKPGDELMSYRKERILLDKVHRDIIFGSLLGDGTLKRRTVNTSCFSLANQEQPGYLLWKLQNLPMLLMRIAGNIDRPRWDSEYLVEFNVLRDQFYPSGNGYRQIPRGLKCLTPLMAAVWYMDDGHLKNESTRITPVPLISIKRMANNTDQIEAAKRLLESLDKRLVGRVSYQESSKLLAISASVAHVFFEIISQFVPPVMEYKLPKHFRGNYVKLEPRRVPSRLVPHPATVLVKEPASQRKYRNTRKYDLQVEGNASYLVGGGTGVVVHNSPETTSGGRALKYWASIRMDIRRSGFTGPADERTGQKIKVKAIKNKVAPPFRVAETNLIYGQGLSRHTDILALAVEYEVIEKKGAYYYYNDENVAHGQVKGEAWVSQHPEIEKAVRKKLFAPDDAEEPEPEAIEDVPEADAAEALALFDSLAETSTE